jgi:hypothetical protein
MILFVVIAFVGIGVVIQLPWKKDLCSQDKCTDDKGFYSLASSESSTKRNNNYNTETDSLSSIYLLLLDETSERA